MVNARSFVQAAESIVMFNLSRNPHEQSNGLTTRARLCLSWRIRISTALQGGKNICEQRYISNGKFAR
jgi:hypothetical protein